jgi:hypothetical protein
VTIARDASSPAAGVTQSNGSGKLNFGAGANGSTSNTFSPPANSLITVCITGGGNTLGTELPTNTGTALTWTNLGKKASSNSNNAPQAWMFQAFNASAQSGIALKFTAGLSDGNPDSVNTTEGEYWIDVWTGCNSSQTGQAIATGDTSATSGNVSLISTQTGSQCLAILADFTASFASTDTYSAASSGGFAQMRAYKASNNGAPGTVNINFSGDTSATAGWVMAELLPVSAATFPIGQICI